MSRLDTKLRKEAEAFALIGREIYEKTSKAELAVVLYHITQFLLESEDREVIQERLKNEIQIVKDLLK